MSASGKKSSPDAVAELSLDTVKTLYAKIAKRVVGEAPPEEKEMAGALLALAADMHLTLKKIAANRS